jgi:preprotein translocase subunit SecA
LRNKQRDEIREVLLTHSAGSQKRAEQALVAVKEKVNDLYAGKPATATAEVVTGGNGALTSLTGWFKENFNSEVSEEEISDLDRDELEKKLCNAVEDRYRPEMRRLERTLLLRLVDMAWKDHLLAMDHLKHSIAFAGYAQMDPKVEYKREGMRMFEEMWDSLDDRVSELVFRIEQLDEGLVSSTWQNASAHKQEASSGLQAAQQESTSGGEDGEQRIEPIRIREQRVGRNDPCPCKSGKKFKNCCMNK